MSSYYDNLITSRRELENIRAYVRDNPARWDNDRFGPVTTYHCGNLDLLHEALVAYVASEPDTEVRPYDTECPSREAGPPCPAPVISTFTSPQERGVLARCLAVRRPFIHVMPGGIPERLPPAVARACAEGWALVLSPSAPGTGVNKQRAIWCNRYVLDRAARITHGYIRPGGTLETLLKTIVSPGPPCPGEEKQP